MDDQCRCLEDLGDMTTSGADTSCFFFMGASKTEIYIMLMAHLECLVGDG